MGKEKKITHLLHPVCMFPKQSHILAEKREKNYLKYYDCIRKHPPCYSEDSNRIH